MLVLHTVGPLGCGQGSCVEGGQPRKSPLTKDSEYPWMPARSRTLEFVILSYRWICSISLRTL